MPQNLLSASAIRKRGMIAAMGATAAAALSLGGLLPLLSITMERWEVPGFLIGLNAATPFLSALLVMPFVPHLMKKLNTAKLLLLMGAISTLATIFYGILSDISFWFLVRFINGAALGVLFAISEAWINHYAPEHIRGRVIGIYVTILSGCFALGPVILLIAGTKGMAPFVLCAVLILLSCIPVFWALKLPEAFRQSEEEDVESFIKFLFIAPTLTLAGIVYGAIEVIVVTFMPIYGIRLGLTETIAATALTAFAIGNLCCQIPLGMIADYYNRRAVLIACSVCATLSMLLLSVFFYFITEIDLFVLAVFAITLFVFGATSVGIYTMAMAEIGWRFKGAALASANAALLFCYNLGSFTTPIMAGAAIDIAPKIGLLLMLALICSSVIVPAMKKNLWEGKTNSTNKLRLD